MDTGAGATVATAGADATGSATVVATGDAGISSQIVFGLFDIFFFPWGI
jgi:hypothetical protein